jgi:hypothetical protein
LPGPVRPSVPPPRPGAIRPRGARWSARRSQLAQHASRRSEGRRAPRGARSWSLRGHAAPRARARHVVSGSEPARGGRRASTLPRQARPRRARGRQTARADASRGLRMGGARDVPSQRQTRLEGQRSFSTQISQRGARARQTRRPCQMRRWGNRPQSSFGTIRIRSRSIFAGSSCRVSPSR